MQKIIVNAELTLCWVEYYFFQTGSNFLFLQKATVKQVLSVCWAVCPSVHQSIGPWVYWFFSQKLVIQVN